MAASPTMYHGTDFLGDPLWDPSDETSPSVESCRGQTPQPSAETTIPQTSCSIDKIYPFIENGEKAKVVAAMALNLLVFDGKLHHSRSNWACPFGHCKENFPDARALMHHVLACRHFSSDKVYCSCCDQDDCFADKGFCGGEDRSAVCHEKGLPMKAKTMRKLTTNITGFFSRSRPASRSSPRGFERPVSPASGPASSPVSSPASTTARRQNFFSGMDPAPRPSSAPRKPTVLASPEPSAQPAVSLIDPCPEMDAVLSVLYEAPDTSAIPELPASECRIGAGQRSDSGFSKLSELSEPSTDVATAPMFAYAGHMTESPTEDLSMDARIPSCRVLQEASAAASSRQVPHEMSMSHFPFPAHLPGAQLSTQSAQYGMFATDGMAANEHDSFAMLHQSSGFPPVASSSSWESTTSPYRQSSGDSWFSNGSQTPSDSCSPPVEIDGFHCSYCGHRPGGNPTSWKAYLNKHIKNQHESDKFPCPGCQKEFGRKDNLITHQKTTCKRRLFGVDVQSARQHPELETGGDWVGERNLRTPKRVRQDSGGAW